jgi:hypothetical protein
MDPVVETRSAIDEAEQTVEQEVDYHRRQVDKKPSYIARLPSTELAEVVAYRPKDEADTPKSTTNR